MNLKIMSLAAFAALAAAPVAAAEVQTFAGIPGVSVPAVGDMPVVEAQYRYERRYERRRFRPDRTRVIRPLPNGCELVTVRNRRPDGSVVVRRFRRC
jgi:hypothetical protein